MPEPPRQTVEEIVAELQAQVHTPYTPRKQAPATPPHDILFNASVDQLRAMTTHIDDVDPRDSADMPEPATLAAIDGKLSIVIELLARLVEKDEVTIGISDRAKASADQYATELRQMIGLD